MDQLRKEARRVLQQTPWNRPTTLESASTRLTLAQLWTDVSSHENSSYLDACESLYAALSFLETGYDPVLPAQDNAAEATAINALSHWASQLALPSSEFAVCFDDNPEITEESRLKSELAAQFITLMEAKVISTLDNQPVASSPDVIVAMASFTSKKDPWTTNDSNNCAEIHLNMACQNDLWPIIERVLREKVRPLFTKTKNPAITSEGRKSLHPVARTRFDGGALDDSTKPWKTTDVYAPAVLSWIICQYKLTDPSKPAHKASLEAHFPLLVPAILALIDDNNITYKIKGCDLLSQLLSPIQESGSDILLRTNLVSVFQEAVTACLLSLPSITPETSSLKLLGAAYPALLALLKATYQLTSKQPISQTERNTQSYITNLSKILRSNLISSFHHISSSTPASTNAPTSFPHPPIATTKTTILAAHPRIWRWRGEILGGLAACWLHVVEERKGNGETSIPVLDGLARNLQSTAFALKYALLNPIPITGGSLDPDQLAVKGEVQSGFQAMVDADPELEGLFALDVADS
ncbi:hypothetical protein N7481_008140 [Penicillium waksmanii]|uniref:uncharacterized protein n=1 Tax=Penicillium waksmanii TaxID=69791 RepID=UPI00254671C0|nr:uncharacterized protein N7481_008140 [Penicillium waksmanii]KAJ5980842.1 hypothetical protein N7481_008140 [Penicillium waksmanii]